MNENTKFAIMTDNRVTETATILIFKVETLKTLIAIFGTNAKVADVIKYFKKGGRLNGTAN